MLSIIYQFTVKENQHKAFIEAWKEMTLLIRECRNGLGSRLHKKDENTYIAYAQWPDKETRDNTSNKLPEHANEVRRKMRDACTKVETLYEMEVLEDLLVHSVGK